MEDVALRIAPDTLAWCRVIFLTCAGVLVLGGCIGRRRGAACARVCELIRRPLSSEQLCRSLRRFSSRKAAEDVCLDGNDVQLSGETH